MFLSLVSGFYQRASTGQLSLDILLGKLYDMMGTYMWTFLLSGAEATFAGLILITTACSIIKDVSKNEKNRNSSN